MVRRQLATDRVRLAVSEAAANALARLWEAARGSGHPEDYPYLAMLLLRLCFLAYARRSGTLPPSARRLDRLFERQESPDAWRELAGIWEAVTGTPQSVAVTVAGGLTVASDMLRFVEESAASETLRPTSLFGLIHQTILDHEPADGELRVSSRRRKTHGAFYTPERLVKFAVGCALGPLLAACDGDTEAMLSLSVFDPACGSGVFLSECAERIADRLAAAAGGEASSWRIRAIRQCVYGVESDPQTVETARLAMWLEVGDAELPLTFLDDRIQERNCLLGYRIHAEPKAKAKPEGVHQLGLSRLAQDGWFRWDEAFPAVLCEPEAGFDAIVGNPPYVAAKNQDLRALEQEWGVKGQSDLYVLFVRAMTQNALLRRGGRFCLVLPDPVLCRENGQPVREALLNRWGLDTLLHVRGLFRNAVVANAVLAGTAGAKPKRIACARIESADEALDFLKDPDECFESAANTISAVDFARQPRKEFAYLASDETSQKLISALHGRDWRLGEVRPPFVALGSLPGAEVSRGEEIGKSEVSRAEGDLPILLGGESLKPYQICWTGSRIAEAAVRKPLAGYLRLKILVQKSAPRPVAALDMPVASHRGFVVPQSLYCVYLGDDVDQALYVTALLNSKTIGDYVFRCFTGYKMRQPQIEIEDLRRIPIRRITNATDRPRFKELFLEGWGACVVADKDYLAGFCAERVAASEEDVLRALIVELARSLTVSGPQAIADSRTSVDLIAEALYTSDDD